MNSDGLIINDVLHKMNLFVSDFVKQMNLKPINIIIVYLHQMLVLYSHLCWCEMGGMWIERSAVGL